MTEELLTAMSGALVDSISDIATIHMATCQASGVRYDDAANSLLTGLTIALVQEYAKASATTGTTKEKIRAVYLRVFEEQFGGFHQAALDVLKNGGATIDFKEPAPPEPAIEPGPPNPKSPWRT